MTILLQCTIGICMLLQSAKACLICVIFNSLHIGLGMKDLKPSFTVVHVWNHLTFGDVLISILKGIWGKDVVGKLNILNSPMTQSVIYHGLIVMAEIHLILLPADLNFTNTTIIKIMKIIVDATVAISTYYDHGTLVSFFYQFSFS